MLRDKFIHYFQQWRERQLSRGEHWLLRSAAPDIMAARKSATTTPAQVSRVISDSASAHSVVIKRIAERGENIQVWIDPVVFNDLLNWLNALDEKYALRVTQIDASAAEKTGMVNVQRLEFGRG